jgi:hypothetical protein
MVEQYLADITGNLSFEEREHRIRESKQDTHGSLDWMNTIHEYMACRQK